MTVRAIVAGLLLPVLFILGIGVTGLTGQWRTESAKDPVKYTEGIFEGQANPADIRGSYSLADIERAFGIPVEIQAGAFGQENAADPSSVQLKIFEEIYGFIDGKEIGTDSMRLFVALYLGLPYEADGSTGLPEASRSKLMEAGADLSDHAERFITIVTAAETASSAPDTHDEAAEDQLVKGRTLFADLLDWGLNQDDIESVLGAPMGPGNQAVRDWCVENGIEFSGVKTALQEELDR